LIDSRGRLIAHPDISLVLRNTDRVAARLRQRGARRRRRRRSQQGVEVVKDVQGRELLTAHAADFYRCAG